MLCSAEVWSVRLTSYIHCLARLASRGEREASSRDAARKEAERERRRRVGDGGEEGRFVVVVARRVRRGRRVGAYVEVRVQAKEGENSVYKSAK